MKKILFFLITVLAWPLVTIFAYVIRGTQITADEYIIRFVIYSIVGLVSAPFLISLFFQADTKIHKTYILGGYLAVSPWVYIIFSYLRTFVPIVILCILAALVPIIGCYIGNRLGSRV